MASPLDMSICGLYNVWCLPSCRQSSLLYVSLGSYQLPGYVYGSPNGDAPLFRADHPEAEQARSDKSHWRFVLLSFKLDALYLPMDHAQRVDCRKYIPEFTSSFESLYVVFWDTHLAVCLC